MSIESLAAHRSRVDMLEKRLQEVDGDTCRLARHVLASTEQLKELARLKRQIDSIGLMQTITFVLALGALLCAIWV